VSDENRTPEIRFSDNLELPQSALAQCLESNSSVYEHQGYSQHTVSIEVVGDAQYTITIASPPVVVVLKTLVTSPKCLGPL